MMSTSFGLPPQVVAYIQQHGTREHATLARCRAETHARLGGQAVMQISPEQGALMQVLARLMDVRTYVEVGTFTGYSALAVALAIHDKPGARVHACDLSPEFLDIAAGYWREAGVADTVTPHAGPGADSLSALISHGLEGRVDMMFIDADKTGYPAYYALGLRLLRPGGLMLIDNMLWGGKVADPSVQDPDTVALRQLAAHIHEDPRVEMTLASVGDGLSVVMKR